MNLLSVLLAMAGVFFIMLSVIGLLKMKDLMLRIQVASKASTLGLICCLGAAWIQSPTTDVGIRAGLTILFLFLTTPIAAQAISKIGHVGGAKDFKLEVDDLSDDQKEVR